MTLVYWAFSPGGVGIGNLSYGGVWRGLCIGSSALELRLEAMVSVLLCAALDSCGLAWVETNVSTGLSSMVGSQQGNPAGHGGFGDGNGGE